MGSPPASPSLPLTPHLPPPTPHSFMAYFTILSHFCVHMPLSLMNFFFCLIVCWCLGENLVSCLVVIMEVLQVGGNEAFYSTSAAAS